VENYCWLHEGVTGKQIDIEGILEQSERVYQFQRVFNLRMGFGTREYDIPPYRAMGPATAKEYESRADRYDQQIQTEIGKDPNGLTTDQKLRIVREYREDRYRKLVDAVYLRRGWTKNGVPTVETLKRLGIDFPDVVALVSGHGG
jgi:aldehyde:ferredoxin oxidoreductase